MILNLLSAPLLGLLGFFVGLLPTADLASVSQLTSQLTVFRSTIASLDWILPVAQFFTMLSVIFAIETAHFTYRIVKWIISLLSVGIFK